MKWFNFFRSVYILKIIDFLGSKFVFQNTICRSTTIFGFLPNYESSEEKGFILKPYGFGEK
jgi:hypothetical protein